MIKHFKNIQNIELFFYLFLFFLWTSIDTSISDFRLDANNLFINLRIIFPYLFGCICISIIIKNFLKNTRQFKLDYFTFCCVFFFLIHAIGLYTSDNSNLNIGFIISCLFLFLIIYESRIYKIDIFNFFKISLFVLSIVLILYGYQVLKWFYFDTLNLNLYGSWPFSMNDLNFLSINLPRSSGLARTAMILFIALSFMLIVSDYKFLYTIPFIFFSLIIILTQSRIILIFYVGFLFAYFVSLIISKTLLNKEKLKIFLIIFLLPILFLFITVKYKNNLVINIKFQDEYYTLGELPSDTSSVISFEDDDSDTGYDFLIVSDYDKKVNKKAKLIRPFQAESITSYRFRDWKKLIDLNDKKIFGYGSMGDRFLINQSASNGLVYSYIVSGFVGSFLYLVIFFVSLYISLKTIFLNKFAVNKENYKSLISSSVIVFFLFRSIVETSFANFSIDFMLFFICLYHLIYNKNKLHLKKKFYQK